MTPDNMTMLYTTVYWHEILENTSNMQETHLENFFRPDSTGVLKLMRIVHVKQ